MFTFALSLVLLMLLSLLTFAGLQWLQLPVGSLIDWLIGGASFIWLVLIVTVPWNIHFQAKQVLADAELSEDKQILVDEQQLGYVKTVARRSWLLAVLLHVASAIGLYILSATGISTIGYISSGAALLLTGLRPAVAAYQYFLVRLNLIQHRFMYPRQDVVELRDRFAQIEMTVKTLEEQLNPELSYSWAAKQQRGLEDTQTAIARLSASLEELRATNLTDHDRLSREARQAIAQLSVDGQFLDHVREIIRFFKSA